MKQGPSTISISTLLFHYILVVGINFISVCDGKPLKELYENAIIFPSDDSSEATQPIVNSRLYIKKPVSNNNYIIRLSTTTDSSWIGEDDLENINQNHNKNHLSSNEQLLIIDDKDDPSASFGFRRNSNNRNSQFQSVKSNDPCEIGFRHRFSTKGGGKMVKCPPINVKG